MLGLPVTVTATEEPAAWAAALCAGSGVGLFDGPTADPRDLATLGKTWVPDPVRRAEMDARYRLHCDLAASLAPLWPQLEALA